MTLQELRTALPVLFPAIAIAGAGMMLAWRPWGRRTALPQDQPTGGAWWLGAASIGGSFIAAFAVLRSGWPAWSQSERWERVAHIALAATSIAAATSTINPRRRFAALAALAAALCAGGLLRPLEAFTPAWAWRAALAAATMLLWAAIEPLADRRRGVSAPVVMMISFAGVSLVLKEARFANLSLAAAAGAAAWGATVVVALLNGRLCPARGPVLVSAALLPAIAIIGWFYNSIGVPWICYALPPLAPLTLWMAEAIGAHRRPPWQAALVRAGLAAVPAGIAIALAMRAARLWDAA